MPDDAATQNAATQNAAPSPLAPEIGETVMVEQRVVACDGGGGPLGHPRVFLYIEDKSVTCPYCSRHFVLKDGAGDEGGH
jgi:uncharacterized Zn-finger protein